MERWPHFMMYEYICIQFLTKPPCSKLLPDIPPLPPGYQIPKTLVLNLSGTLFKTEFVFGKGTEIIKRPGLSKFLRRLSELYEVVILTDDETMVFFNKNKSVHIDSFLKIRPYEQYICRTIREGITSDRKRKVMNCSNSRYLKDLQYLNRPINRIVVVDSS